MKRRDFLKKVSVVGLSIALLRDMNLFANGESITLNPVYLKDNYKAMVCIRLAGGNDSVNMLIDKENYQTYFNAREAIAHKENALLNINDGDKEYGLCPTFKNIETLFNEKKVSFIANVGSIKGLKESDGEFEIIKPARLGSHNSQQLYWDSLEPDNGFETGWAGRVADAYGLVSPIVSLPMIYGIDSNPKLIQGNRTKPYQFASAGTITFEGFNKNPLLKDIFQRARVASRGNNSLSDAYEEIQEFTISKTDSISNELKLYEPENYVISQTNNMNKQLKLVTNIIKARDSLGLSRQIFTLTLGAFDSHSNQTRQNGQLTHLDTALGDFQRALEAEGLDRDVITFITSDFGRTVSSNGAGTDHGWGGHYFVMGSPEVIDGGKVFGEMPNLNIYDEVNSDLTEHTHLIPSLGIEEYLAPICKWFGLNDDALLSIFPNYKNFNTPSRVPINFIKNIKMNNLNHKI